tara:strand:+ start:600 stop:803 length:204 start_codon:yes stop_codon:yes gene_type:complete
MSKLNIGDLVKLSLHGKFAVGYTNITDKIGIVLCNDLLYDNLYLVKWLSTGVSGEVHKDFIEKLEEK